MAPWAMLVEDHAYKFPGDVKEWPKPGGIYGPMLACAVCAHFPDYHRVVPQNQRVWGSPSVDTGVASYPVPVTEDEMEREGGMERQSPLHPETRFESLVNEKERRVFGPKRTEVTGLTFAQLRQANLARVRTFPGHQRGLDIEDTQLAGWTFNDWMVALVGEVGELANMLKKRRRGWDHRRNTGYSKEEAAEELADIQTYLDLLAACLGVNLGEATISKFNVVSERAGLPDRL